MQDVGGHDPPGGVAHLLGGERLGQVIDGAELHRLDGRLEGGERGDDDDADARLPAQDFRQHVQPGLVLQPQVEEDHVEPAPLQGLKAPGGGADAEHARVVRLQAEAHGLPQSGVIIQNKRGPGGAHGWPTTN